MTGPGRFVPAGRTGVQHTAFATGDIGATIQALIGRGARMLPVPSTHYAAVAAQWGLAPARLAWLRNLGLRYDRDERGEFLHAYAEPFDGRFLFEIVQRIGGYRGYGAARAAPCMAARQMAAPAG